MSTLSYRREVSEGFRVAGLSTLITRPQSQNASVCHRFWQTFNAELAAAGLRQKGKWQKYAITYPHNSTYRYLCGIPDSSAIAAPDNFERVTIPAGTYIVFDHVGPTIRLAATMSMIYRRVLPELGLQPARGGIFHFERYDHRFHWNRASSIIEIWVPIID